MQKIDAIHRPITEAMRAEAKLQQNWLHDSYQDNSTTRAATPNRDVIGDLAHQVIEGLLDELDIDYHSTRKERYKGGDEVDITVKGEAWDIKGTRLPAAEFFVFDKQMRNPKLDEIDKFCFVQINREGTEARIFSLCPVSLFKKKKQFAPAGSIYKFQYDNWGVALFYLPSFKDWIMSQPATINRALVAEKLRLDKADYNHYNVSMLDSANGSLLRRVVRRYG